MLNRVFRTFIITLMIGAVLGGRCLPCRDLLAKAATPSCCDKAGACNKIPTSKSEKRAPCPLQQNVVALQKAGSDLPTVHLANVVASMPVPQGVETPVFTFAVSFSPPIPHPSRPPLYVLHERLLI